MTDTVTRKALMQPVKLRRWSYASILLLIVCAGIAYFLAREGDAGVIFALPVAVVSYVALAAVAQVNRPSRERKLLAKITSDARKAMIEYIGREPKYISAQGCASRSHAGCAAGTGIAFDGQNIFVLDDGEIAQIPWKLVRSWRWSIEGYDLVKVSSTGAPAAVTLSAQLEANAENARASVNAKKVSGFFVSVADTERPDWQFTCWDRAVLQRWNEIFTQIDEGRLQAA